MIYLIGIEKLLLLNKMPRATTISKDLKLNDIPNMFSYEKALN